MSKIKIRNFGPIRAGFVENDGFLDIRKVTVFIGNQATGKSTVAKLISVFTWLEKMYVRGDFEAALPGLYFKENVCGFQGLTKYFSQDTEIEYQGDQFCFKFLEDGFDFYYRETQKRHIDLSPYLTPKIMYIPSERNFLMTIRNAYNVTGLPGHLFTFGEELKKAQKALNGQQLEIPINNYKFEYDQASDSSKVIGETYQMELYESSSGLQSSVPLYIVARSLALSIQDRSGTGNETLSLKQSIKRSEELAKISADTALSDEDKRQKTEQVYQRYINKCFINIVEEPEQNLFPTSQRQILNSLLTFCNMIEGNKLIVTTHSPFIINNLSISIQGKYLEDKIMAARRNDLLQKLAENVPQSACVAAKDVAIYQLEENGSITLLPDYNGIPSDRNYLNNCLAEGNEIFGSLLEIEEEL